MDISRPKGADSTFVVLFNDLALSSGTHAAMMERAALEEKDHPYAAVSVISLREYGRRLAKEAALLGGPPVTA